MADNKEKEEQQRLHHGNPPWHAVALVVGMIAIFMKKLLEEEEEDHSINAKVFSYALFPNIIPLWAVVAFRLLIATIIFCDLFRATALVIYVEQKTEYYPGSKLRAGAPIEYHGYLTKHGTLGNALRGIASFTMITWTLEGVFFLLSGLLPLLTNNTTINNKEEYNIIISICYRVAMTLWKIMVPSAFLVSLIVTYVLWPMEAQAAKEGKHSNLIVFQRTCALLSHCLNVLAITIEVSIMGGLPYQWNHYCMAPLYGTAYVIFSWIMKNHWISFRKDRKNAGAWGPQFIYPFLDTTLGWQYTFSILALLLVLFLSHGIVCGLQYLLTQIISPNFYHIDTIEEGIANWQRFGIHCSTILFVGIFVCRFR